MRIGSALARTLALVVTVLGLAALAQSSARAEDAKPAGDKRPEDAVELLVKDETPVLDLIRLASLHADVPITWSEQDKAVTGKILTSSRRIVVPRSDVFETVRALLAAEEIVLVPNGSPGHRMYAAIDARTLQNQFILRAQAEHVELNDATAAQLEAKTGLFVEAMIPMPGADYAELREVRTALSVLVTGQNVGRVQEVPSAQALVVTDYAPTVAAIYRIAKSMRKPEQKAEFFLLRHARADAVEAILDDLLSSRPAAPLKVGDGQTAVPAAPRPDSVRIVSDPATNQVIVLGSPAQLALARQVVEHLDIPARPAPGR